MNVWNMRLPAFLRRGGCDINKKARSLLSGADGAVGKVAKPPYGFPRSAPFDRCASRASIRKLRDILYQPPRLLR